MFKPKKIPISATELKNSLIHKIQNINDPEILESILKIVELEEELRNSKTYRLTPEFERKLDETIQEVKSGKYLTDEEANREIEQWFEEE